MAQTSNYQPVYKNSKHLKKGITYIAGEFSDFDFYKVKTRGVKISINGGVLFEISFDDSSQLTTGDTYMFNKDCVVAFGNIVDTVA